MTDREPGSIARPLVHFGRAVCDDLQQALRREWLVTNGIGGFASGTVAGAATRRYHGSLIAALEPPVGRVVLAGPLDEWAGYLATRYPLSTHEWESGAVSPSGHANIQSFRLEGLTPVWTYAFADALIEKRIWMARAANVTFARYDIVRASAPVALEIRPLITCRDFHALPSVAAWQPAVAKDSTGSVIITAFAGATPVVTASDRGKFEAAPAWYRGFRYREEAARGLDSIADLYCAGVFSAELEQGESFTLALSAGKAVVPDPDAALREQANWQRSLLLRAGAQDAEPALQQLVLAADQFVVQRPRAGRVTAASVIAGYPWFNDWGRDTMIALPGLLLATGRAADAATTLRTFAGFVRDGLIPNNFPDWAAVDPAYNTADASLWFILAIRAHAATTGELTLVDELMPTVSAILDAHIAGTRYGIGADPLDGLLRAGRPGLQVTWMDAKVADRVITPRTGKPVEINALWYNALVTAAGWCTARGDSATASRYQAVAQRAKSSFRQRFLRPGWPALADVVDGPDGDDWSVRPNQIFAISLPEPLIDGPAAVAVLRECRQQLLTSYGLRSLASSEAGYSGACVGTQAERDGAYHQGTVWAWLLGPFAEAWARVTGDREAALSLLRPFSEHLADAGLGSISEIFDGDPPHTPRGCIAQAWSVAEVLRVWRLLSSS